AVEGGDQLVLVEGSLAVVDLVPGRLEDRDGVGMDVLEEEGSLHAPMMRQGPRSTKRTAGPSRLLGRAGGTGRAPQNPSGRSCACTTTRRCVGRVIATYRSLVPPGPSAIAAGSTSTTASNSRPFVSRGESTVTWASSGRCAASRAAS